MKQYKNNKPRKKGWDYSQPGMYYITICTYDKECILGQIQANQMIYSPVGEIVRDEWTKSFEIRKELLCLSWIIMPNHIHAILKIVKSPIVNRVRQNPGIAYRPPRSISSFVAGFKSSATKRINQYRETPGTPVWQDLFHDQIIGDDAAYQNIHNYIKNNPTTWNSDCR